MAQTTTQTDTTTVVGVFEDYSSAERASRQLTEEGIPRTAIQVQSNFRTGAAGSIGDDTGSSSQHEGGFMGWWHSLFNDDDDVRRHGGDYAEAVRRGNAVVTVTGTREIVDRAADIMNSAGAIDVDQRVAGWRESGYTGYDANAGAYDYNQATEERNRTSGDRDRTSGERTTIPVVQEELQVGKRVVKRGGVRVYSHMVEQPANEQITLREEHARVERRPVDREVSDADVRNMRDQSIEVTETAEEAVISKRARVREEVAVGKETTERTQQVKDTIRHTEVNVERLDGSDTARDYDAAGSGAAADYDATATAYGSRIAADPSYRNRRWEDVEDDLRADYTRTNPGSTWDKVKASVRRGWDDVTGRR